MVGGGDILELLDHGQTGPGFGEIEYCPACRTCYCTKWGHMCTFDPKRIEAEIIARVADARAVLAMYGNPSERRHYRFFKEPV